MSRTTRREEVHVAGHHYLDGQWCDRCGAPLVPPAGEPYPAGSCVVLLREDDDSTTWKTTRPATCAAAMEA